MAKLAPNLPFLANVPDTFVSPFPSDSAQADDKYNWLINNVANPTSDLAAGVLSRQQGLAWAIGQQICLKSKAVFAGDLRSDWLPLINWVEDSPGGQRIMGAFSSVELPTSTDGAAIASALGNTAFNVADSILSAVPVYGQIISGVLDVGRFIFNLFMQPKPQIKYYVPWKEYSKGTDEAVVNDYLRTIMEGVEWTALWGPSLDWEEGFRFFETEEGEDTRAWGTFSATGGAPRRRSYGKFGCFGFMPGTESVSDVVQFRIGGGGKSPTFRKDLVISCGDFTPAASEIILALWAMVQREGSPDMYKVRAGDLARDWGQYFGALRGDFKSVWKHLESNIVSAWDETQFMGKCMEPLILYDGERPILTAINDRQVWPGVERSGGRWRSNPNDGRPYCPPDKSPLTNPKSGWGTDPEYQGGRIYPPDRCRYNDNGSVVVQHNKYTKETRVSWVDEAFILPELRTLKQRQREYLYRTLVCAYVRPRSTNAGPAYDAFNDTSAALGRGYLTHGEELRARCEHAREVLLERDLRFTVRLEDVDAIDPEYADRLRESGVTETSWKQPVMGIQSPTGHADLGESAEPPPAEPPRGGSPFARLEVRRSSSKRKSSSGSAGPALLAAGAVALMLAK